MKVEVYAIIICYNPDLDLLLKNVESISNQVKQVIIVDNCSRNFSDYKQVICPFENVTFMRLEKNEGIAFALNFGLDYCIGKCKWFISLDQDSCASPDMVDKLLMIAESKDGIIAPLIVDRNSVEEKGVDYTHLDSVTAITSGCLNNVEILKKVGGFDNKLFIDFVDHEICLRLKKAGYSIRHSEDAIGNIKIHHFWGLKVTTTNHSPFRRYFLFRNRLFVYKKYYKRFPLWCFKGFVFMWRDIFVILFFEKQKRENLKNICRGLRDGILNTFNRRIEI